MRRSKIITNKVLILLVLSGLFNLFSFAFDQMVIQSELKMRELNREMKLNRVNLESLTYSLNTINDLSVEVDKASNMFWKDLSFNMWASLAFDPENNNGWVDVYDKESILNVRNSYKRKFNELVEMDGVILTKADVDEKGGAPLSISYTIKKPILFLGVGQEYKDIEEFDKNVIL